MDHLAISNAVTVQDRDIAIIWNASRNFYALYRYKVLFETEVGRQTEPFRFPLDAANISNNCFVKVEKNNIAATSIKKILSNLHIKDNVYSR